MNKYPKIIIDGTKNSPADIINAEQNYDFLHHTHKMSDIVNDGSESISDGKSAYESWLSLGNTGTEQDFINSLKGNNGVSPVVVLSRNEEDNGVAISITDINGKKEVVVYDGKDGNSYEVDLETIANKLFEGMDTSYLVIDKDTDLTPLNVSFSNIINQINELIKAIDDKSNIDDELESTETTWSSSKIQETIKDVMGTINNHTHTNLNEILDKFTTNESNLKFDNKTIITSDIYDMDSDGKVDYAKTADSLNGLLASLEELNYLVGLRGDIQSQIDSLISGVNFKGEFNTFAIMQSTIATPEKGDLVYILFDEIKDQTNTQYIYNGETWIYGGGRSAVNEASDTVKGIIQLSGDLTGTATSPRLIDIISPQTIGYIKSITIDKNGRVTNIVQDDTLEKRLIELESRPQIYISETQPENFKDGDIWIEG